MQRYKLLETLGSGSMGIVHSAYDRLTRQTVALKQVVSRDAIDMTTDSARLSLIREFQVLASLRHPNIIDVLDFGFDEHQTPYFTMQLLQQPRTIRVAIADTTLADGMRLIVQMLQALSYLHRQGIVHRDVKPNNVLVTPDGTVKLLDFGLASQVREYSTTSAGTLAYMSPEVVSGQQSTRASDLWAVGVMLYEFLAGKHPFDGAHISQMLTNILLQPPDLSPLTSGQWMYQVSLPDVVDAGTVLLDSTDRPKVAPSPQMPIDTQHKLSAVISQLLEKDPARRDLDAYDVIDRLCEAAEIEPPIESEALRHGVLHAARFVGRGPELALLNSSLKDVHVGRGSAWLIAGEAGVGKSRLLDEIRVRALVDGHLVLRGQATEIGDVPYKMWRDVLTKLLLQVPANDEELAVVAHVVPTIGEILERSITPQPVTEGTPQAITDTLVELVMRYNAPMVLMLEDVHWADAGLDALRILAERVSDMPLLLIASYRSDEAPYFYGKLHTMQLMELERLTDDDLRELCRSILGEHPRTDEITDFLIRETEGNVFFVLDVLHSLAYHLPRLDEIGQDQDSLPEAFIASGVMELAMRRVARLPIDSQPMMRVAAVAGREVDFNILRHIDPVLKVDALLSNAVNAAILEYVDEKWRFQHDKLREGILHGLIESERPRLHRLVAEAIEHVYADQLDANLPLLAYHWRMAEVIEREAHYTAEYTKKLLQRGELQRALAAIEPLLDRMDDTPTALRMELVRLYANARAADGNAIERIELYGQVMSMAQAIGDRAAETKAMYDIAWMWLRRHDHTKARHYFERAKASAEAQQDEMMIAHTINGLAASMYHDDPPTVEAMFKDALARYQALGSDSNIALVGGNLGAFYQDAGKLDLAEQYLLESLAAQERIGNRYVTAHTLMNLTRLEIVRGNWATARDYLQRGAAHFREIGYESGVITGTTYQAWIDLFGPAQNPANAAHLLNTAAELAESQDNPQQLFRVLTALPLAFLRAGRQAQAKDAINRLAAQVHLAPQPVEAELFTVLALAHYAMTNGDTSMAQLAACTVHHHPQQSLLLRWQLDQFRKANPDVDVDHQPDDAPDLAEALRLLRQRYLS